MHYCGIAAVPTGHLQLVALTELRTTEPPVRLVATFYEPGTAEQVAGALAGLGESVVGIAASPAATERACDRMLKELGVPPSDHAGEAARLIGLLAARGLFPPGAIEGSHGSVDEGTWRSANVFETNADAVFCALGHRRLPARRHPFGVQLRIHELEQDHVEDPGGSLWHRRIEEVDAAGTALCAHRYAVGHACWLGDPREGVVVLPGNAVPARFTTDGVLPAVERTRLPGVA
jgi:hypothetical protein